MFPRMIGRAQGGSSPFPAKSVFQFQRWHVLRKVPTGWAARVPGCEAEGPGSAELGVNPGAPPVVTLALASSSVEWG